MKREAENELEEILLSIRPAMEEEKLDHKEKAFSMDCCIC